MCSIHTLGLAWILGVFLVLPAMEHQENKCLVNNYLND